MVNYQLVLLELVMNIERNPLGIVTKMLWIIAQ